MEHSLSVQFVLMRANAEVKAAHSDQLGIEHLFLGLLKLAELHADDIINAPDVVKQVVDKDMDAVRERFVALDIDTTRTRGLLRYMVSTGQVAVDKDALDDCLDRASSKAEQRHTNSIWAQDILSAILDKPTDTILQVCPISNCSNQEDVTASAPSQDEMSKGFLPNLTSRIRNMRAQLLSKVFGQDHVVHAFAEGMFAAEVLAASDEKRKRPRAIFVFAGPPGVGKTFLAEQAAEALDLPYKRFDMSSFADHQAYMSLVGFEKSYHGSKEGTLTGFVRKNPHSILLFDEIEKAHANTINQFLQVLDAGRLTDRYHDEDVCFRDTVLIFTTNAGSSLYDGEAKENAAGIPRKTILNALETEINSLTGQSFFPATITSRMATGWPLLFNHLQAHHLEKISGGELSRMCGLFERQYEIKVKYDDLLPTALLLQEGGLADARILRAQTELFFKNEVFKVCRLWGEQNFAAALQSISGIHFSVETNGLPDDIRLLFMNDEKPEILLYGSKEFSERCKKELPEYKIYYTQSIENAMEIVGEKDIRLALVDIAEKNVASPYSGITLPSFPNSQYSTYLQKREGAFDYASMAAGAIHDGSRLFQSIHERMPELPVYLLETEDFPIDAELEMSFMRAGARGKLVEPQEDFSVFEDMLASICRELYTQSIAMKMAVERKTLYFETAPKISSNKSEIIVRLRNFSVKRAIAADDMETILDSIEKPDVRFSDVIGAVDAKDELKFFIDYLKNPKRFTAHGIKPPKGVLLYGPPGTGKTMLAKAMAGESDVTFIPCVATGFVTKYQGSGPEAIRTLFRRARKYAPAIIFIDEIDAIGRKRGQVNSGHGEEMALNALLAEMDGFSVDPRRPVFVMAATNFDVEEGQGGMGMIDPALSRRFDCKILVDLPNTEEREEFIRMSLAKDREHIITDEMIKRIATRSMGMSPSDLAAVVKAANRMAMKSNAFLDDSILDEAFEQIKHGAKKDWGYEYLERVARHESGHALMGFMSGNTPSYLTIVARGDHGGYMEHMPNENSPLLTKKELLSRIRVSLAGRAAEIVYYGDEDGASTGASGDLMQATKTASAIICRYGMDQDFGLCTIESKETPSQFVLSKINEILVKELNDTIEVIGKHRSEIDLLVSELMKKNKLSEQEIRQLLECDTV